MPRCTNRTGCAEEVVRGGCAHAVVVRVVMHRRLCRLCACVKKVVRGGCAHDCAVPRGCAQRLCAQPFRQNLPAQPKMVVLLEVHNLGGY